jgi:hypothetical protein
LDADPVAARQRYYKGFASRERECECEVRMSTQQFDSQLPIDIVIRKLCRLCNMVHQPTVTGRLVTLPCNLSGSGVGKMPENMYLEAAL